MATPTVAPTGVIDVLSIASADSLDERFVEGLSAFAGCTLVLSFFAIALAEVYNARRQINTSSDRLEFELPSRSSDNRKLLPSSGVPSDKGASKASQALVARTELDVEAPERGGVGNDPQLPLPSSQAVVDPPRVQFALCDPLLLLILLQSIVLTGRLSGLPISYTQSVCAPFQWATLELNAPGWAASFMALRGVEGLAELQDSDSEEELPTVASLRGQMFYVGALVLVSLLLHASGRLASDPRCFGGLQWAYVPPSLKYAHVEVTALLACSVGLLATTTDALLDTSSNYPQAWRLYAALLAFLVLCLACLLGWQAAYHFRATWVPEANVRRLRALKDVFPDKQEEGDGSGTNHTNSGKSTSSEGLTLSQVKEAAPSLGLTEARAQILFYDMDRRGTGRVDKDAYVARVDREMARQEQLQPAQRRASFREATSRNSHRGTSPTGAAGDRKSKDITALLSRRASIRNSRNVAVVAFGEANWVETAWALSFEPGRRAGAWHARAPSSSTGGGVSGGSNWNGGGFVVHGGSAPPVAPPPPRSPLRLTAAPARVVTPTLLDEDSLGFWAHYFAPFVPHHVHYYALHGLGRSAVVCLLLNGLTDRPQWQALSVLCVELAALVHLSRHFPCSLLAQSRVEVVASIGRVAVYLLAWISHATNPLTGGWFAGSSSSSDGGSWRLSSASACSWMAAVHLFVLVHACFTYLAPMVGPTARWLVSTAHAIDALATRYSPWLRRAAQWSGQKVYRACSVVNRAVCARKSPFRRVCRRVWRQLPPCCLCASVLLGGVWKLLLAVALLVGGLLVAPFLGCYFLAMWVRDRTCPTIPGLESKAATKRKLLSDWQAREDARMKAEADEKRVRLVVERLQQAALKAALKEDADARFAEVEQARAARFLAAEERRLASYAEKELTLQQVGKRVIIQQREAAAALAAKEAAEAAARKKAHDLEVAAAIEAKRKVRAAQFAAEEAARAAAAKEAQERRWAAREELRMAAFAEQELIKKLAQERNKVKAAEAAATKAANEQAANEAAEAKRKAEELQQVQLLAADSVARSKTNLERQERADALAARLAAAQAILKDAREAEARLKAAADEAEQATLQSRAAMEKADPDPLPADSTAAGAAKEKGAEEEDDVDEEMAVQTTAPVMTPPTVARKTATIAKPPQTTGSGKKNNAAKNSSGKSGIHQANNNASQEEGGHARRARAVGEAIGGVLFMDPGARAVGGLVGGIGAKIDAWGARRRKKREAREAALMAGEAEADELALAGSKRAWEARRQSFKAGTPSDTLLEESALSWRNEQKQQQGGKDSNDRKGISSGDDSGSGGGGGSHIANNNNSGKKTKQVTRPKSTRAPLHQNPRRRPNSNASKSSAGSTTTDTTEASDYSNLTPLSSVQAKQSGQRIGTSLDDVSVAGTSDGAVASQQPSGSGIPGNAPAGGKSGEVSPRTRSRSLDSALGTRPAKSSSAPQAVPAGNGNSGTGF